MKKVFLITLFLLAIAIPITADTPNQAVKSDIKAYIDYTPINSYNIDGYTYVIAEELSNYGFTVVWSETERTLNLHRQRYATPMYTKELWERAAAPIGETYQIYRTDIQTFLDDTLVNSYNIGGQTVIQIDEFTKYGEFNWYDSDREVSIKIFRSEMQSDLDHTENTSTFEDRNVGPAGYEKFTGQLDENNRLHGIGKEESRSGNYADAGTANYYFVNYIGNFEHGRLKPGLVHISRSHANGKTGASTGFTFIGDMIALSKTSSEKNIGVLSLPKYRFFESHGIEIFPVTFQFGRGVWCESDTSRGRKGISFYSWYDGNGHQTTLETKSADFQGTQITTYFTEYIDNNKTFEETR